MYRFFATLWDPKDTKAARQSDRLQSALIGSTPGWSTACQNRAALVAHHGFTGRANSNLPLARGSGVVLGTLFDRRYVRCNGVFDDAETDRIIFSHGSRLVENYWGSYLAFLWEEEGNVAHVLRDPTGNLPCYHMHFDGVHVFFSHITDCLAAIPADHFHIDARYLTRWLIFSRLTSRETGLDSIKEVLGGERVTLSNGTVTRTLLWNPVNIAFSPRELSVSESAIKLEETVQWVVDAWASCYDRITLRLSGGLDSAIVAACLSRAPSRPQVTSLHFRVPPRTRPGHNGSADGSHSLRIQAITNQGDERYYARLVARRWDIRLRELDRSVDLPLSRLWQAPLMISPAMYFTSIDVDDAELELTSSLGVQAFFSGQTGDSVFLASTKPFPAIDYAFLHGITPELLGQIISSTRLSRESFAAILWKVLKYAVARRPYRRASNLLERPTLLTQAALNSLTVDDVSNWWCKPAAVLPPGKSDHVQGLSRSAHYDYVFHSGAVADHIDPLNSQPLWELALSIPTYVLLTGGVTRGLARHAFRRLLPAEIRNRQSKGTGTQFYETLVLLNRKLLRESLLDGLLVADGYLSKGRIDAVLRSEHPFQEVSATHLLSYLSAEIWLQQWKDARQGASRSSPHFLEPVMRR